MMPVEARDRTPVRNGLVYCSPRACGAGCTVMAHDQASIEARELCERLGPDWEPELWENLGWHYRAVRRASEDDWVAVYPRTEGSTRDGGWKVTGYGATFAYHYWHDNPDPQRAVNGLVIEVTDQVTRLQATLATIKGLVIPGGLLR